MIEEYPAHKNPHKDSIRDVISTLNLNLARKTAQLAGIALCSIAGIVSDDDAGKPPLQ
jgi:hypothetical protein